MQAKRIKEGKWYETIKGPGKCVLVNNIRFRFAIAGKILWLVPKEVKHEIVAPEAGDVVHAIEEDSGKRPATSRYQIQLRRWEDSPSWSWNVVDHWSGGSDVAHGEGFEFAEQAAIEAEAKLSAIIAAEQEKA